MSDTFQQQATKRAHRKWDSYRRISAWAGLLELFAVIAVVFIFGSDLSGGPQRPTTTFGVVFILMSPAVLAGLFSGSRFFALYAGYAERLNPTAELSDSDAATGGNAALSFIGDGLWGTVIAGIAGGVVATFAFSTLFGPFAVIFHPLFVLLIGITWYGGWAIGAVISAIFGTALGITFGVGRRKQVGGRLPWILVAALLPTLVFAVVIPVLGTQFSDGRSDPVGAMLAVIGFPVAGAEFIFVDALLVLARVAIWVGVALFIAIVVVGTPALLHRRSKRNGTGSEATLTI